MGISHRHMKVPKAVQNAHKVAINARRHSHSPYSAFAVGAAIQLKGVKTAIGGCNIENASFGGTICAERVALHSAVATHGEINPEFVLVVTGEKKATVPCAICLQTLAEFCTDECLIYLANEKEVLREYRFSELLPHPFRIFKKDKR